MRVLCVARHPFLSEHLERLFGQFGVETAACVGLREAADLVAVSEADVLICDYDLLAAVPRDQWDADTMLSTTPIIAVSMTRHASEAHLPDDRSVAAFFYLPTLEQDTVQRVLAGLRRQHAASAPPNGLSWPAQIPASQFR